MQQNQSSLPSTRPTWAGVRLILAAAFLALAVGACAVHVQQSSSGSAKSSDTQGGESPDKPKKKPAKKDDAKKDASKRDQGRKDPSKGGQAGKQDPGAKQDGDGKGETSDGKKDDAKKDGGKKDDAKPGGGRDKDDAQAGGGNDKEDARPGAGGGGRDKGEADASTQLPPSEDPDDLSTLVVPVTLPLAAATKAIESMIPTSHAEPDWVQVTKKGGSPDVDARYEVWRDKIQVKGAGATLQVTIPLHYAADFRAKVKNPVIPGNWISVTERETWSTKDKPQDLTVVLQIEPKLKGRWKLRTGVEVKKVKHGPSPSGKLCATKVGVKVCVTKKEVGPYLHKRVERVLVDKLQKELDKLDAQLNAVLDVESQAGSVWEALQQPISLQKVAQSRCPTLLGEACKEPAWVVLEPRSAAVSRLQTKGDTLRVDVAISGMLGVAIGEKPAVKTKALPKIDDRERPPAVDLRINAQVSPDTLSRLLSKSVRGTKLMAEKAKKPIEIQNAKVIAVKDKAHPQRVTIVLSSIGALEGELRLAGDVLFDSKSNTVRIQNLDYDTATASQLEKVLSEPEQRRLRALIHKGVSWNFTNQLRALTDAASAALTTKLPGKLSLKSQLKEVSVRNLKVDDGLTLQLVVSGKASVQYAP